jgi:hypothetical protein
MCGFPASGSRRKGHDVAHGKLRVPWVRQTRLSTSCIDVSGNRLVSGPAHRNHPPSLVQRASPPSHTTRPVSRGLPVDPYCNHRWTSRVAIGPLCLDAVANTPAGRMEFVCSYDSIRFGLPSNRGWSAPAHCFRGLLNVLSLRPACSPSRLSDPLHERLLQSRCLRCCSDCYRVERTSSRVGIPPLWTSAFSRRTRYRVMRPLSRTGKYLGSLHQWQAKRTMQKSEVQNGNAG